MISYSQSNKLVLQGPLEPKQYTSVEFADHLRSLHLRGSMGRRGQCWNNALAESFFATLMNELVYRTVFATQAKARTAVADYIERFYNQTTLCSTLGYKTPVEVAAEYRQTSSNAA